LQAFCILLLVGSAKARETREEGELELAEAQASEDSWLKAAHSLRHDKHVEWWENLVFRESVGVSSEAKNAADRCIAVSLVGRHTKFRAWINSEKLRGASIDVYSATTAVTPQDDRQITKPEELREMAAKIESRADWEKRLLAGHLPSVKEAKNKVELPIEHWPHFQWEVAGEMQKPNPAKVYGLNRTSLGFSFEVNRGLWDPSPFFRDYKVFRANAWRERQNQRIQDGKSSEDPDLIWHVDRIHLDPPHGSRSLKLTVQQALFSDVIATAESKRVKDWMPASYGRVTLGEFLAGKWRERDNSHPFYPAANQLMVLLMVLTCDGKAVLARQGEGAGAKGQWANSVCGHVHGYHDSDDFGRPDPGKAATREAIEEIGLRIEASQVRWMALVVGLVLGSVQLHGEVQTDLSEKEILKCFDDGRDNPEEIKNLDFVRLEAAEVANHLKVANCTNNARLGLALCLWRRGLANILYPLISHEWAYFE
jgi:8-oxo-dGTP pyrophosphatase MutT (NUDIX family)